MRLAFFPAAALLLVSDAVLLPAAGPRLLLIGDSTVATYSTPRADRPTLTGWGQVFGEFFHDGVTVINRAQSGASSKSFITNGLWSRALTNAADYLFIQFGHNDQPGKEPRSTAAARDFREYLRRYITEARAKGVKPVLVTPVARRTFAAGRPVTTLGPYTEAMKEVGKSENVPVIDLHAASRDLYARLGDEGSADLSPSAEDRTHFSRKGAYAIARLVAAALPRAVPDLRSSLKAAAAVEELYVARPLTAGGFTTGIEGPACDRDGNIFCVSYLKKQNIARVTPDGRVEAFVQLPETSAGNGIRFARDGSMFIADYPAHNVLRVDVRTKAVSVFAHDARMNQPNDLAIAPDGTLYASDPNWKDGTGQLWRIARDGRTHREEADMGTSNGIEVSPDGRTLYVNESVQRNVWAFDIAKDGSVRNKRLLKKFDHFGFDGMRCDVDGNLYITRHGKGTVVKLSPTGDVLLEIDVLGPHPTNICFGGNDGRTAYVTEAKVQRLVRFRVERPGLEWQRWQE